MQIPILEGHGFDERDDSRSAPVMIVNEAFVRKYFPGQNALGKHIKVSVGDGVTRSPMREVVGVVGNTKRHNLTSDIRAEYFLPFAQAILTNPRLLLRTTGDPLSLIRPLHGQLAVMDKNIPLFKVQTFDDLVLASAAAPRFQTLLVTGFAAIALGLSAIGLYAVLSYMVAQRTLEIGLRIALGAQRSDILRLILRRGLALAVIGLGIGVFASLTLTRFMAGLLYEVRPFDPLSLLAVSAVLLAVAVVASSAPALRAARLDPMTTLRQQ